MNLSVLIVGIATIILIIIVIKLATKHVIKVTAISLVLAVLGIYLFVVFGNADEDIAFVDVMTEYTLEDLSNLYCKNDMSKTDKLKCECFVQPLMQDMKSRFTGDELEILRTKRAKYAIEIAKSYRNKRNIIKQKLKDNNAVHLLKEIKSDLKDKSKIIKTQY